MSETEEEKDYKYQGMCERLQHATLAWGKGALSGKQTSIIMPVELIGQI